MVVSPSLIARIRRVPPEMKRAALSEASTAAASLIEPNVFTSMVIAPGAVLSCRELLVPADRLEARLVDLLAHHLGHDCLLAGARREAALPLPEGAIAVRDGQQADMRHVVEEGDRGI